MKYRVPSMTNPIKYRQYRYIVPENLFTHNHLYMNMQDSAYLRTCTSAATLKTMTVGRLENDVI